MKENVILKEKTNKFEKILSKQEEINKIISEKDEVIRKLKLEVDELLEIKRNCYMLVKDLNFEV
jgi:hypothetical protein